MATKKPTKSKSAKAQATSPIPEIIYAQASPHSVGGVSLFEGGSLIDSGNYANFNSEPGLINRAVAVLAEVGFTILQISPQTINIAGSRKTYEAAFNTRITAEERDVIKASGEDTASFLDSQSTDLPGLISTRGTRFSDLLEGVALEEPRYYMGTSMFPPLKAYWHLDVPAGVSLGCNADKAHRGGTTGKGIKIAMPDSGHFKHPFFTARGYRVAPVTLGPGATFPLKDENGHGTGESANIFATAPDIDLFPVKMNFVNTIGAFNAAMALAPHIISCSWGSSKQFGPLSAADLALVAIIAAAVANNIIVVFSSGADHFGFPGQHPDVISAGGVFMQPDETLIASNHAAGFASNIYPGRKVPDLSGLVGMKPKAMYIMLPVEPNDELDQANGGGVHPMGDETSKTDGWAAFSGTSAAAPQLAGAAALIKQVCMKLTPVQVRSILMKGAKDVTVGTNNSGNTAGPGYDLATGAGLVDAHKSVMLAKLQCIGLIGPPITVVPPIQPGPVTPVPPPLSNAGGTGFASDEPQASILPRYT